MSFKKWLLAIGGFLGITAGVFVTIPQLSPFAAPVKAAGAAIEQHAEKMRDDCPDSMCSRDPRTGRCAMCGVIAQLDGGFCECR